MDTHLPLQACDWSSDQDPVVLDNWAWVANGPNKGIQLKSGRVLIPGHHAKGRSNTENTKSSGHIMYAEESIVAGETPWMGWKLGAGQEDNDLPHFSEFDLQELQNGTVIMVARANSPGIEGVSSDGVTHKTPRPVAYSEDGGLTVKGYHWNYDLTQPLGQEIPGALLRIEDSDILVYSSPANVGFLRKKMSLWYSKDIGKTWYKIEELRKGMSGQSGLIQLKSVDMSIQIGLLFELSLRSQVILEPDYIVFRRLALELGCMQHVVIDDIDGRSESGSFEGDRIASIFSASVRS